MAERLNMANISYLDLSSDMANAFGSVSHEVLDKYQEQRIKATDFPFFSQKRHRWYLVTHADDETQIGGRVRVGAPMGDKTAPKEFLGPFNEAVLDWQAHGEVEQKRMRISCPKLFDGTQDGRISSFADDI